MGQRECVGVAAAPAGGMERLCGYKPAGGHGAMMIVSRCRSITAVSRIHRGHGCSAVVHSARGAPKIGNRLGCHAEPPSSVIVQPLSPLCGIAYPVQRSNGLGSHRRTHAQTNTSNKAPVILFTRSCPVGFTLDMIESADFCVESVFYPLLISITCGLLRLNQQPSQTASSASIPARCACASAR